MALAIALSGYFCSLTSLTVFPWLAFLGCTTGQARFRFRFAGSLRREGLRRSLPRHSFLDLEIAL